MKIKKRSRPIISTKNGKDLIFESVTCAAKTLGVGMTSIYKCLRGELVSVKGFTFKLDSDILPGEVFRKHPIHDVEVSNKGRCLTRSKTKTYGWLTESGYRRVTLQKAFFVHRLVLETFKSISQDSLLFVDHIDRDRSNNCLENLRWVTSVQNNQNKSRPEAYRHPCPCCTCFQ